MNRTAIRHFARHFAEMLLAMLLGMAVVGLPFAGILLLAGSSYAEMEREAPVLVLLVMGIAMTAPMAAWMRHRGHDRARVAEMAAAMLALTAMLVALALAGAEGKALVEAQHGAMILVMLGVMLFRWREYSRWSPGSSRKKRAPASRSPASPGGA